MVSGNESQYMQFSMLIRYKNMVKPQFLCLINVQELRLYHISEYSFTKMLNFNLVL